MITVRRNHWFGLGVRVCYVAGDFLFVVFRFAWWQVWISLGGAS